MKLLRVFSLFTIHCSLALALFVVSCGEDSNDYNLDGNGKAVVNLNRNDASLNPLLSQFQFPKVKGGTSTVISHATNAYGLNYSLEWDHELRGQRWTCFYFCTQNNKTNWNRSRWNYTSWGGDPFQWDPDVPKGEQPSVTGEFSGSYYPGSNTRYDRGHICASQDRMCSQEVNEQTFYMTNMMPQVNSFNAKLWAKMEDWVRDWRDRSMKGDTLYVVKGGTIDSDTIMFNGNVIDRSKNLLALTRSGFPVPRYFFMALYINRGGTQPMALAFWAEHLNADHSNDPLSQYVVNIRELERRTGIDFFCNLPDDLEEQVETRPVANIISAWGL